MTRRYRLAIAAAALLSLGAFGTFSYVTAHQRHRASAAAALSEASPAAASTSDVASAALSAPSSGSTAASATPDTTAAPMLASPTVGPLFAAGLNSSHHCTASVVDSPHGDLLVTAAHCISGAGTNLVFAPGYRNGHAPYGTWAVKAVYASPQWLSDQSESDDFAFVLVTGAGGRSVQAAVGGNVLSTVATTRGQSLVVSGYTAGLNDAPIICATTEYRTSGFPSFDCPGFAGGTSGSPWITDYDATTGTGDLVGVIGGLHQGGCDQATSYSAPFGPTTEQTYQQAVAGGPGAVMPSTAGDGC
ncbi:hypothetical protein BH10ACT8_BH10ACT8_13000 [soil metagenome]